MIVFSALGTVFGIIMGAVPGLNGAVGASLLLPFTFSMDPAAGILMLGGIYMGGMYGGSITAILINVPGDVVATCTAIEGHPLAKEGRAREALYYSIFASTLGGLLGILSLIFFTPPLASIALKFGPPEMMLTALCGLTVVGSLSGNNMWKALLAVCIGLLIPTVGMDQMSTVYRLTFGTQSLKTGFSIIPICLGFFCFAEMFRNIGQKKAATFVYKDTFIKRMTVILDILKRPILLLKSSIIGILVGILPGVGGTMAIFLAYGEAKRTSKHPETFGKGNVEGIIAAESANNSLVGGAMVPMLALGIPGSPTAAIVAAALTMHGIICGPDLFIRRPDVAYLFMYGMLLTIAVMALIGIFGIKYFSYILKIKMNYIIPLVLVFAAFGAYSINNNMFDVFVAIAVGIVGTILTRFEVPIPPIIVGAVLSPLIEQNLRRSLEMARAEQQFLGRFILGRPLSLVLVVVVVVFFILFFRMRGKKGTGKEMKVNTINEQ